MMLPIVWTDKFKVIKSVNVLRAFNTYEVIGIGTKEINGKSHECWHITDGKRKYLIPKETINALHRSGRIVKK